MPEPAAPAIRVEGLTRAFDGLVAVDDLALEVAAGTVFGFLGPNGAGKTTTIRLLLGLLEPTRGSATVLGLDTRTQAAGIRARAGALLEHAGLYERLSAADNLEYFGRIWRLRRNERRARIRALLEHFGLWERRREIVDRWSRGMKQKLAVARALLHHPALVFLDEPTAGLDPVAAAALREDLAALAALEGTTIFLTTHNLAEAERLCANVAVIRRGRLLAVGHPDELRTRGSGPRVEIVARDVTPEAIVALERLPAVRRARLENGRIVAELADGATPAPLVAALVHAGAAVEEVRRGKASLEEVFLTLMAEGEAPVADEAPIGAGGWSAEEGGPR